MKMMKATLLCLCVGVLGAAAQVNPLLVDLGNLITPDGFAQIDFVLRSLGGPTRYPIANASDLLADPAFNASKVTAMYFHGFQENYESLSTQNVTAAFLVQNILSSDSATKFNVIAVDWGVYCAGLSRLDYTPAFLRVPAAGFAVATAINRMVEAGLSADNLWLIGHDLGGQLVGNIAKNLAFKPFRITGLDPAGPGFAGDSLYPKLGARDATYVDVIHTDAGVQGYPDAIGTTDFWPNGGRRQQPGCTTPTVSEEYALWGCSHQRSWKFFADSAWTTDPGPFIAIQCDSWEDFQNGLCQRAYAFMGFYNCDFQSKSCLGSGNSSNFYLPTAAKSPYGLGYKGVENAG